MRCENCQYYQILLLVILVLGIALSNKVKTGVLSSEHNPKLGTVLLMKVSDEDKVSESGYDSTYSHFLPGTI
jgi:hypothetical protein